MQALHIRQMPVLYTQHKNSAASHHLPSCRKNRFAGLAISTTGRMVTKTIYRSDSQKYNSLNAGEMEFKGKETGPIQVKQKVICKDLGRSTKGIFLWFYFSFNGGSKGSLLQINWIRLARTSMGGMSLPIFMEHL